VKEGLVPETRYSVNPDDEEVEPFFFKRQKDCISSVSFSVESTGPRAGLALEGNTVISQLTNALTIQNEFLEDANVINRKNQIMAEEHKEKEKD
jgi:hypothetical protein